LDLEQTGWRAILSQDP